MQLSWTVSDGAQSEGTDGLSFSTVGGNAEKTRLQRKRDVKREDGRERQ